MQSTAEFSSSTPIVVWDFSADPDGKAARCTICRDGKSHQTDYHRRRHEQTASHQNLLADFLEAAPTTTDTPHNNQPPTDSELAEDGLRNLLASLAGSGTLPYPAASYENPESPPGVGINWNLMEIHNEGNLAMSADEQAVALIASNILERFNLPVSDEEPEERSEEENSDSEQEPEANAVPKSAESQHSTQFGPIPTKRARMQDETAADRYWFPWPDRISCTLDILMHLPRSVFSQKQLDLFLWLLKVNEVDDVPSIKQMQKINSALQKVCGIETIAYDGALGHKYFVNSLAQMIAQEMANPRVRPHLHFYPEDSGTKLSEARQAQRLLHIRARGLSRAEAQKEYNIHFLCTSNLAQPLEMLDGIVEQLEEAQGNGIWVWDIEHNEPVLVIPEVLALLGDNPMQREFACHIGLRGKLFCRACWVKGHDAMEGDDADNVPPPTQRHRAASDAGSVHSDGASVAGSDIQSDQDSGSEKPERVGTSKRRAGKRFKETMGEMVDRVKSFMKTGRLRRKPETTEKLRSFFTEASTKLDTKTKVKNLRTETGLKDTFQLVFIEKLFASYQKKRGTTNKQAALDAAVADLPQETTSPVWRIRGLDPHQDTPVEILHVVLLGFLKGKDDKKELLIARLTSVDVTGLGISPLAGKTLVQYSGSLTGRDFRAIAQVAPFVLYDLVSAECLETWQALSKLVPLIWQPEIHDINTYVTLVTKEIDNFLLCAAKWTTRWFNKPKFHIFLHLPAHI
ncbi:hypothetical protein R3P38DRAFT_2805837 [Favolaschia claudopus]|uniref:Transposase n=1 Tax=Favolaschia claudopus TaxID=2862362 RepID=A0AAV9ZLS1_9AGAR